MNDFTESLIICLEEMTLVFNSTGKMIKSFV